MIKAIKGPVHLDYVVTATASQVGYLSAVLERRLQASRCPRCHKVHVPPRPVCPLCAERSPERLDVGPGGVVTTFSVIRIPFEGQRVDPPYACAHILLDGADAPLLHIVAGCTVDEVKVGMRVEPVWSDQPEASLASIRYYRPQGSGGASS